METRNVPVLLLTGYLGSGKTTLLNRILANRKGIRFAVIVNDIGEVNIDADLIQKGGIVNQKDDSLVALQNGCICCTLKMDLIEQIFDLMKMQRFDYIVIEASGICEPEPIAQTICSIPRMGGNYTQYGICRLDCITTVVDALRMQSEFACGDTLTRKGIDEEDIENLIIQQIEFCNIILLNKASEVTPDELRRIQAILHTLQPTAEIIPCDYADVELDKLLNTRLFNFERVATSAGWIRGIERQVTEEEEREDRERYQTIYAREVGSVAAQTSIPITTTMTMSMTTGKKRRKRSTTTGTKKGIITITTTMTMRGVRWKNTASGHSSITAARPSTSTSSTASSPPAGPKVSSVAKGSSTSPIVRTCPTCSSRPASRRN